MAQSTALIEVSCPDDAKAIATLMNKALRSEKARVKVKFKAGRLNILLEYDDASADSSVRTHSRQRLISLLARQITHLQLDAVDQIYVYGRRRDTKAVVWGTILKQTEKQPPDPIAPVQPLKVISSHALDAIATHEDQFIERIRLIILQAIDGTDVLVDVELEGLELLISLEEASHPVDILALINPIKRALAKRSLGNLKVAKIYYRHAQTQQIIPIKAISLKR